jgi:hypothetical protein
VLPVVVERPVSAYLRLADRLLPGRVAGLYVVGSTALGAFQDGRSDIDLVVVLDGPDRPDDASRLRALHLRRGIATGLSAIRRGRSPLSGTCNTTFVRRADLTRPAGEVVPVATPNGSHFRLGAGPVGFVDWAVFARYGVPVRGPAPAELGLDPEPDRLRAWNHENLDAYWRPWAARYRRLGGVRGRLRRPSGTVWAVLGVPRLHCTIATGRIVSKLEAGEYALCTFEARWHPLIRYALARRSGAPTDRPAPPPDLVADFVEHVVESAHALR